MPIDLSLMEERSKALFGQAHRLAVMVAIAHAPDGRVNPTDLALELGLAQSAFQAPLRGLVKSGLLTCELGGRRIQYVKQPSKVWDWVLEVEKEVVEQEARLPSVRRIHSS